MSPDGSAKPPPEERLLRLIRGQARRAPASAQSPLPGAEGAAGGAVGTWSPIGQSAVLAQVIGSRVARLPWRRVAIWGLSGVLGIEAVMMVMQMARPMPVVAVPRIKPVASEDAPPDHPVKPVIPSLAQSASPSVFSAPTPAGAGDGTASTPKKARSETVSALRQHLSLVGVVSGDPKQAIIEDTQNQKTYFVAVGQEVTEGAMLREVQERRVVLELEGETFELTL